MRRMIGCGISVILAAALLAGCGQTPVSGSASQGDVAQEQAYLDLTALEGVDLEDEAVALSEAPAALSTDLQTVASGILVKKNEKAVIDYSNTKDGYVMVQFTASTAKRLKALVKGPTTTYQYNLNQGQWAAFPLSDGNGTYQVIVYENIEGTKYATILTLTCDVALTDEFAPFLRPNQYVDYSAAPNTGVKAEELTNGLTDPLKKVEVVYN